MYHPETDYGSGFMYIINTWHLYSDSTYLTLSYANPLFTKDNFDAPSESITNKFCLNVNVNLVYIVYNLQCFCLSSVLRNLDLMFVQSAMWKNFYAKFFFL